MHSILPGDTFREESRDPHDLLVSSGNLKELKNQVHTGRVDVKNWRDGRTSQTLFHVAAASNQVEIIQFLTSWTHSVVVLNAQDKEGNTALHIAVINGHREAMEALLDQKIDDKILNNNQDPALHIAFRQGSKALHLIEDFIDHPNVNILVEGRHNQTSLHVLTKCDNVDALRLIHAKAASRMSSGTPYKILAKDRNGATILHTAAREGAYRIIEFLFSISGKSGMRDNDLTSITSYDKKMPLHYAVENSHIESVQVLLNHGADCTILSGNHSPPVHMACSRDKLDILKLMVDVQGKDILQARDQEGGTVLHSSTSSIHSEDVISYLVANGVGIDEVDHNGLTPLANAILFGSAAATESLLKNGADPLIKNKQGCNALFLAVLGKRTEVFKKIVASDKAKIMAEDPNNQGMCSIHCALKLGLSGMLDPLLTLTQKHSKDEEGNNYIHLAAMSQSDKILLHILSLQFVQSMINETNHAGLTPLHFAAMGSSLTAVEMLIDHGAIIHKSNTGITPFMLACSNGNLEAARLLFSTNRFQKNWVDHYGNTSLHLAVDGKKPHVISFCLDQGTAITLNNDGLSFFDRILDNSDQELTEAALLHKRWEECIDIVSPDKPHSLLRIIDNVPDAYRILLDQCFSKSSHDPSHHDYWEEFNFKGVNITSHNTHLNDMPEIIRNDEVDIEMTVAMHTGSEADEEDMERMREEISRSKQKGSRWHQYREKNYSRPLAIVRKLIESKHESYLLHPVVVAFIKSRWNGFSQYYHLSKIYLNFLLALLLTVFVSIIPLPQQNLLDSRNTSNLQENATCCESFLSGGVQVLLYIILPLCAINLTIFFAEVIHRYHLFTQFSEALVWVNFIASFSTIVFLSSILVNSLDTALWDAAAVGVCFAWLSVGFNMQLVNFWNIGVYITVLMSTTLLIVKVLMIMFFLFMAFSIPLYILVGSEETLQFTTIGDSMFEMLTSLIGVTDYPGFIALEQKGQLRSPVTTFIFLVAIVIMLPIVTINVLIGLAVGDIARIRREAIISRRTVEVHALAHLDNFLFPHWIFKRWSVMRQKNYPNQRKSLWQRINNLLYKFDGDKLYTEEVKKAVNAVVRKVTIEEREFQEKRLEKLKERIERLQADQVVELEGLTRLETMIAKIVQPQGL